MSPHQQFTAAMMALFPTLSLTTIGILWREDVKDLPAGALMAWIAVTRALGNEAHLARRAEADAITAAIGRPGAAP